MSNTEQHLAINLADDYLLHVSVTEVPTDGTKFVLFETQWLKARNPNERQKKFSCCLPPAKIAALAHTLLESLQ